MKLYAQHGAQAGEKVAEGCQQGLLDGVIFGPRDISRNSLEMQLGQLAAAHPNVDRLFDPQYYSCLVAGADQSRLGYLPDDYTDYFAPRRRIDLSREAQIRDDIRRALEFQTHLPVTHLIAPNIVISRSFDSRETAVAVDFISNAYGCYEDVGDRRPLLLTLAISRDALLDRGQLTEFITELTGLGSRAAGFYVLTAAQNTEARSEVFHSDVIASRMFINYALKVNGFTVVNGYSDILTPFLQAAGADAGATGWWSNLRAFSLARFSPGPAGGRLPIQRYLSIALLNRITFAELDILRNLAPFVLNGLGTDALYPVDNGSEPQRNQEVFQSWDALRTLIGTVDSPDIAIRLQRCGQLVQTADDHYREIQPMNVALDPKSNSEHLNALREGLRLFGELAELGAPRE